MFTYSASRRIHKLHCLTQQRINTSLAVARGTITQYIIQVFLSGFRLVALQNKDNEKLWNFTTTFNQETGKELEPDQFKTKLLLIHDAVEVISAAMKKLKDVKAEFLSCDSYKAWNYGSSLLNFMKTVFVLNKTRNISFQFPLSSKQIEFVSLQNKVVGLTRSLIFDGLGQRTDVTFDLLELTSAGNQSVSNNTTMLVFENNYVPTTADIFESNACVNEINFFFRLVCGRTIN